MMGRGKGRLEMRAPRFTRRLRYRYWLAMIPAGDDTRVEVIRKWPPLSRSPKPPRVGCGTVEGPFTKEQAMKAFRSVTTVVGGKV